MFIQKIAATMGAGVVAASLVAGAPLTFGSTTTDDGSAVNSPAGTAPLSRLLGDSYEGIDGLTGDRIQAGGPVDYLGGAVVEAYRINGGAKVNRVNERPEWMVHQVATTLDFTRSARGGRWALTGTITTPGTYELWINGGRGSHHLTITIHERPVLVSVVPGDAFVWPDVTIPTRGNMAPAIALSGDGFRKAEHLNICLNGTYQFSLHRGEIDNGGYPAYDAKSDRTYAVGRITAKAGDVVGLSRAVWNDDPHTCGRQFTSFVVTSSMLEVKGDPPVVDNSSRLDQWGENPPGLTDY